MALKKGVARLSEPPVAGRFRWAAVGTYHYRRIQSALDEGEALYQ